MMATGSMIKKKTDIKEEHEIPDKSNSCTEDDVEDQKFASTEDNVKKDNVSNDVNLTVSAQSNSCTEDYVQDQKLAATDDNAEKDNESNDVNLVEVVAVDQNNNAAEEIRDSILSKNCNSDDIASGDKLTSDTAL